MKTTGRKPVFRLFRAVTVTLAYLRRNTPQQVLAEQYGTSQSTISRTIARHTPILEMVLRDWVPTVEDLDPNEQFIIDGTLLPCWSWRTNPELWSGKHRTTGMNLQVACTLTGQLAWISDALPGSVHDSKALRESGFLDTPNTPLHVGDKGYIGLGMLTPIRKQPHQRELPEHDREFNRTVNSIRATIERVIANLKTWRTLHTDYRRPLHTFTHTISTIIALEFYRTSFE